MKETILDNYARNQLSDEEKDWIKQQLKEDPNFQKELDLHADLVQGIQLHMNEQVNKSLKTTIQEVDNKLEQDGFFEDKLGKAVIQQLQLEGSKDLQQTIFKVDQELAKEGFFTAPAPASQPKVVWFKRLIAAASILLICTLAWQLLAPTGFKTEEQYQLAFRVYDNQLSQPIQLELSEQGFAGNPQKKLLQQLLNAMEAYDQEDYTTASQLLKKALDHSNLDQSYQLMAEFYLALSYMANQQEQLAIPLLKNLAFNDINQQEHVSWYLALAYLKQEQIDLSKNILENLISSQQYGSKAQQLLDNLS